jgi:hypothetical protein
MAKKSRRKTLVFSKVDKFHSRATVSENGLSLTVIAPILDEDLLIKSTSVLINENLEKASKSFPEKTH